MSALVPQIVVDAAEGAARSARFPVGGALEFADLELDSRAAALDRLRAAEPISWVPALGGWLVTSHALARELLSRGDFTVMAFHTASATIRGSSPRSVSRSANSVMCFRSAA